MNTRGSWFTHSAVRLASLSGAIALSLAYLVRPAWLAPGAHPNHTLLALACFGMCAMFVHGVGFEMRHRIARAAFHPMLAWLLAFMPLLVRVLAPGHGST